MENPYLAIASTFLQTVLALAVPILAAYLAKQIKSALVAAIAAAKANTNAQTQALIDNTVNAAVLAAEQLGGAGSTKLTYAIRFATDYLDSLGIDLNLEALRGLVEAEVKREFGKEPSNGTISIRPTLTVG